ncbi:MAG: CDP-alcohol phosphatidyltransferase family protein [Cyanobacteriota bacterium]|nr:CDP-alcohol phosphatidyltransferase family protein [Cyanobacteriota bacterium]
MPESNFYQGSWLELHQNNNLSIIGQIDLANFLTLTGLGLSFISAILALQQDFNLAIICLIYAGLADVFDGYIARRIQRTELQSAIGKQLDNLVDICAFGFSPAIFAYCFGLNDYLSILILISYVAASGLRLAFFNSVGLLDNQGKDYFIGLPVTCISFILPVIFGANFFINNFVIQISMKFVYLLLTILMVANFKVIKPQGYWYVLVLLFAVIMTMVYALGTNLWIL